MLRPYGPSEPATVKNKTTSTQDQTASNKVVPAEQKEKKTAYFKKGKRTPIVKVETA